MPDFINHPAEKYPLFFCTDLNPKHKIYIAGCFNSAYMAQFSDSSLENISEQSEEELLKFAKKQVAMFHKHSDGSDVHLVREKGEIEAKIEGEEKNYTPDHGPIRLLCTCGKQFELSNKGRLRRR